MQHEDRTQHQGNRKVGRPSAPVQEPTGADSKNPEFIARRSSPEFAVNRILTASSTLRWPCTQHSVSLPGVRSEDTLTESNVHVVIQLRLTDAAMQPDTPHSGHQEGHCSFVLNPPALSRVRYVHFSRRKESLKSLFTAARQQQSSVWHEVGLSRCRHGHRAAKALTRDCRCRPCRTRRFVRLQRHR